MLDIPQIEKTYSFNKYKKTQNVQQNSIVIRQSKPSFKGIENFNDYQIKQIKDSKLALSDEISAIFRTDRAIIDDSYTGETEARDKFSKMGYYLFLKEKEDNELNQYLQNQNIRILHKEYNDFYNTNLKSYSRAAAGTKEYLNKSLNETLKNSDVDGLIEKKIDAFFFEKMQARPQKDDRSNNDYLNSGFAQRRLKEFSALFKENPLMMPKENIHKVFQVINKQLDYADKTVYDSIYENLDNLSEALYLKDKDLMLDSWKKLTESTVEFYKTDYLREVVNDKDVKVKKLDDFLNSNNYRVLNQNNKLSLLFEYRGSGELTLSEKAFLVDKYNQAQKDKKSYGIDMLDFLVNKPANNKIRKQIVKNLVESQEFAQENFDELKKLLIQDINNRNYDSDIFNIKLDRAGVLDLILSEMDVESYYMSPKDKVDYLSTIADEDIEKYIEKLRKSWMDEKFVDALNFESDKYDMAKQTDNILNTLTIDLDGKQVGINEFLDKAVKNIYGQNADIMTISKNILNGAVANNMLIMEDISLGKKEYDCLMNQMDALRKSLANHNAQTENFYKQISRELDKLEMNCPWLKPQVKDTRSVMEKIRDGLFNEKNIIPLAASGNIISHSLLTAGAATMQTSGVEPHGLACGAILMLLGYASLIGINVYHEFKRSK